MPQLVGEGGRDRGNGVVIVQKKWGGQGRGFGGEYLRLSVSEIRYLLRFCPDAYWKTCLYKIEIDMSQSTETYNNNNKVAGVVGGRLTIWQIEQEP